MTLPNQFSNVTEATGAQLDENFNTVGRLAPLPCVAAGSNDITLALLGSTPTVPAYADYMQFTAIAAASNTGAGTATLTGLAQLPIYKDSPAGPVALAGGEIIQNCEFTLLYDSALNSGGGGFHLYSMAAMALRSAALSLTSLQVGGAAVMSALLTTVAAVTLGALTPGTTSTAVISLSGVSVGDMVRVRPPSISVGLVYQADVLNAGSITMIVTNAAAGVTITPVAGSHRAVAERIS